MTELPVINFINVLGIPGIIGYLFYKEVGGWMRRGKNGEDRGSYKELKEKIDWLYDSHHKFDGDGVPIWYVRKSLETTIIKLSNNIDKQTEVMQKMLDQMKDHRREIEKVEDLIKRR